MEPPRQEQVAADPLNPASSSGAAARDQARPDMECLIRAAPIGFSLVDRNLSFLYVNERMAQINGRPAVEHIGRHIREVIPQLAPIIEPSYRKVLTTGLPLLNVEISDAGIAQRGQERYWLSSYHPAESHDGTVTTVCAIVQDITARKRAEDEILRAKKDWEQTFDAVPDLIAIMDRDKRILRVNRAMADRLGRAPADLVGRPCHAAIYGGADSPDSCTYCRALAEGLQQDVQMQMKCLGGEFLLSVTPLYNVAGEIIGGVHVARDITGIKSAEAALQASETRLRTALESIPFDVFVLDADRRYVMQNSTCREHWGDILGERPEDIAPDEQTAQVWASNNARAFTGTIVDEEVCYSVGHKVRHLRNIIAPIAERDHVRGILGINIDITPRKLAELELDERYRFETMLADLSAGFVNLPDAAIDGEIEKGLSRIVQLLKIDRCTLMQFSDDASELRVTHSCAIAGLEPMPRMMVSEKLPYLTARMRENQVLLANMSDDVPVEAAAEREYLQSMQVKSSLAIPLRVSDKPLGCLAFISIGVERIWPPAMVQRLRLAGEIFANALARKRSGQALEMRYRFEALLADLSARFVNVTPRDFDSTVEMGLRSFVEFLEVDRSTLMQFSGAGSELRVTHSYATVGVEPLPVMAVDGVLPWYAKRIRRGEVMWASRFEDFPDDAPQEKKFLKEQGIRSSLTLPLKVGGTVLGALTFVCVRKDYAWDREGIQRLQLVAGIFANALARRMSDDSLRKALLEIEELKEKLEAECYFLRQDIGLQHGFGELVGESSAIADVLDKVARVAKSQATVLILGETGTGKELVARAIHNASPRASAPLVKVDCTALPADLIESELFGHEKGAFTGAHARQVGRFEIAHGATIFLDEIGELPLKLQAKLLRVLQDGEFERLGNPRPIKVDVRIIAATNRNLLTEIRAGRFREDLWYRLNVFPITVPPLRERKSDLGLLVAHFTDKHGKRLGKAITTVPQAVMEVLQGYHWPGNVRELENVIERAVICTQGTRLRLAERLGVPKTTTATTIDSRSLDEVERDHILRVLRQVNWRVEGENGAAAILDLNPSTLRGRMRRLQIRRPKSHA